jgi:hypothetical protein
LTPASNSKKLYLDGVATSNMKALGDNLNTAPTGQVDFTAGAITVGRTTAGEFQKLHTQIEAGTGPSGQVDFTAGAITVGRTTAGEFQKLHTQIEAGAGPTGQVDFTAGAVTVGFDGTAHGYLTELGAADPATAAITYVDATAQDTTACIGGTTRFICAGAAR